MGADQGDPHSMERADVANGEPDARSRDDGVHDDDGVDDEDVAGSSRDGSADRSTCTSTSEFNRGTTTRLRTM